MYKSWETFFRGILTDLKFNRYVLKTLKVKTFVIVNMSTECIASKTPVRVRQQGLQLDGGLRWQLIIVLSERESRSVKTVLLCKQVLLSTGTLLLL